jgi:hypothetical protein
MCYSRETLKILPLADTSQRRGISGFHRCIDGNHLSTVKMQNFFEIGRFQQQCLYVCPISEQAPCHVTPCTLQACVCSRARAHVIDSTSSIVRDIETEAKKFACEKGYMHAAEQMASR